MRAPCARARREGNETKACLNTNELSEINENVTKAPERTNDQVMNDLPRACIDIFMFSRASNMYIAYFINPTANPRTPPLFSPIRFSRSGVTQRFLHALLIVTNVFVGHAK